MHVESIPFSGQIKGLQEVFLPKGCWILDVQHHENVLRLNVMTEDTMETALHRFLVVQLPKGKRLTDNIEINIDNLLLIDSCSTLYNQYFVFEILDED